IIRSDKSTYPMILKAIEQLDQVKRQVLIEVLIAEVTFDSSTKLGIEWASVEGAVFGSREGFNQARVFGADDIVTNVLTGGGFAGYSAAYLHDTIQVGSVQIPRIGVLVNAFQERSDVDILSTPQILATDHEEAEILVGENRAFIKNAQVTPEGGTVRTFEFRDVGLSLRITPHITDTDHIRLDVYQKVEDVIGQTFEGAVETSKREARTSVSIKDQDTIVIGGLIREKKLNGLRKVPILGDIPLLGLPFRSTTEQRIKTNLFIFISPHIIGSEEQMMILTEKSQNAIEEGKSKKKARRGRFEHQ
ncbi:MAG: hypothetical protein Q8Q33_04770, partial [Chlamydiota bacterium]|nr:hypothetical protein [Chlamydiota bacterium]